MHHSLTAPVTARWSSYVTCPVIIRVFLPSWLIFSMFLIYLFQPCFESIHKFEWFCFFAPLTKFLFSCVWLIPPGFSSSKTPHSTLILASQCQLPDWQSGSTVIPLITTRVVSRSDPNIPLLLSRFLAHIEICNYLPNKININNDFLAVCY